jgi:sec-independent protein translocase protein TatB
MLDFGWAELLIIGLIVLLVVGPQDIPKIMYQAGRLFRRLHYMKFALSQQFDDFMEKAEQKIATEQEAAENAKIAQGQISESQENVSEDSDEELLMDESNPYFIKADDENELDSEDVAIVKPADETLAQKPKKGDV